MGFSVVLWLILFKETIGKTHLEDFKYHIDVWVHLKALQDHNQMFMLNIKI